MNDLNPAWIGVIGTLLGGLLVGFLSLGSKILENRFQSEREDRQRKLDKQTDLLVRIARFRRSIAVYFDELQGQTAPTGGGKERFNQITDAIPVLDSLISVYANEAVPIWIEVKNSLNGLESAAADYLMRGQKGMELKKQYNLTDRKCVKLEHALILMIPTI